MIAEDLLPCAHCGGEPKLHYVGNEWTKSRKLTVKCKECRIQLTHAARMHDFEWLEKRIADDWNRRFYLQAIADSSYEAAQRACAATEVLTIGCHRHTALEIQTRMINAIHALKGTLPEMGEL